MITLSASPGDPIKLPPGPEFPAETTVTIPFSTAVFTALIIAVSPEPPPRLKDIVVILYTILFVITQSIPLTISEVDP